MKEPCNICDSKWVSENPQVKPLWYCKNKKGSLEPSCDMHMHVSLPSVLEPLKQGYLRRWPHCQWPSYLLLAVCPDTQKIPRYTTYNSFLMAAILPKKKHCNKTYYKLCPSQGMNLTIFQHLQLHLAGARCSFVPLGSFGDTAPTKTNDFPCLDHTTH